MTTLSQPVGRLTEIINDLPEGVQITLVALKRYSDKELFGVHLVTWNNPASNPRWGGFGNRVVGLWSHGDAQMILDQFMDRYCVTALVAPLSGQDQGFRDYVRAQVIPLEWKGLSTEELDQQFLFPVHGRVRHFKEAS